jgi:hypothetical protein
MGWSWTKAPVDTRSVEYASNATCIASPEAYLAFYESDDTYCQMAQDVIKIYVSSEAIHVEYEPYS